MLHTSFPSGFPKMLRIPFQLVRIPFQNLSGIDSPKKPLVLIWTKKSFVEDFHIKIFNWKRKRSNSKIQDRCAYPTTTNIALLCKMVRITFLFPTRKNLSGSGSPTKKPLVLIWTKKSFFKDFHIKIFNWKRKHSNSIHFPICRIHVHTRLLLT